MADVELKPDIISKLEKAFSVPEKEINDLLKFFNTRLKPAIKAHYLSHLVSSIEEMINEQEKKEFLNYIKKTERAEKDIETLTNLVNERRIRLFTINLQSLSGVKRKAKTYKKVCGVMMYYADY